MKEGPEQTYISFYPDEEAQGGALRETLMVRLDPMSQRTIDIACKRARRLHAKSFVMFQVIPRVWHVDEDGDASE